MLGMQYFYLHDLHKADYYFDRFMRGKFELKDSKIRGLNLTSFQSKIDSRVQKNLNNQVAKPVIDIMNRVNQLPYKLKLLQMRSRDGFYKLSGIEHKEIHTILNRTDDLLESDKMHLGSNELQ